MRTETFGAAETRLGSLGCLANTSQLSCGESRNGRRTRLHPPTDSGSRSHRREAWFANTDDGPSSGSKRVLDGIHMGIRIATISDSLLSLRAPKLFAQYGALHLLWTKPERLEETSGLFWKRCLQLCRERASAIILQKIATSFYFSLRPLASSYGVRNSREVFNRLTEFSPYGGFRNARVRRELSRSFAHTHSRFLSHRPEQQETSLIRFHLR